jgi:hypothetical protein
LHGGAPRLASVELTRRISSSPKGWSGLSLFSSARQYASTAPVKVDVGAAAAIPVSERWTLSGAAVRATPAMAFETARFPAVD